MSPRPHQRSRRSRSRSALAPPSLERELQRDCERYLEEVWAWRAVWNWYHRPDRKPGRNERAGLPDLVIAVGEGIVLGVELKTPEGQLTPEQVVWLRAFGERGAVCRSLAEFQAFLSQWVGVRR